MHEEKKARENKSGTGNLYFILFRQTIVRGVNFFPRLRAAKITFASKTADDRLAPSPA